jgi:hypothetical protein
MNNRGGHCSEKEEVAEQQLKKKKKGEGKTDNWCRLLGTSSLEEGAV